MHFEDIKFEDNKDKIRGHFLDLYYFDIDRSELDKIDSFKIVNGDLIFSKEPQKRFDFLLLKAFQNLTNKLTKKPTIYIHKFSGIPLIGNNAFGLIDRNTSIIEVRIMTGCNINCIYCSVTQDSRTVDFVVEKDYLVQEFKELVKFKKMDELEAHIGTQGEPLLYKPLADLIKDLSAIPEVSNIVLDTNGTLLTEKKVDELVNAGLTRFSFSVNALDPDLAQKIAGTAYNIDNTKKMLKYISKKDCQLIITPVWTPGINDEEIPKLIKLSKELGCDIGIQNFLNYKHGKNPVKQMSWDLFIEKMKELEKQFDTKLLFNFKEDFNIRQSASLPKPFKKGDIVKAKVVCPGRFSNEVIAVADNRTITVIPVPQNNNIKVKITRSKHNIFYGTI